MTLDLAGVEHVACIDGLAELAERSGLSLETFTLIELDGYFPVAISLKQRDRDQFVAQVGTILTRAIGESGMIARVGDSSFAMLWARMLNEGQIAIFCMRLLRELATIPICRRAGLSICPRIGIHRRNAGESCLEALQCAKQALSFTDIHEHRYQIFTQEMKQSVLGRAKLRSQLADAMEKQRFSLVYQPRVNVSNGRTTGVEALIRWEDEEFGSILPEAFVDILERSGDIFELTRWVFNRAARELKAWLREDPERSFSFNLSASVLSTREMVDSFIHGIDLRNLKPGQVIIEVTESTEWSLREKGREQIEALRRHGVRFALDDFGTGFSTFDYLRQMPLDILKVDKSFISRIESSSRDRFIVETIVRMAREFDLEVVAEGVENEAQLKLLSTMHVDSVQGYCFARPMPVTDFLSWFSGS